MTVVQEATLPVILKGWSFLLVHGEWNNKKTILRYNLFFCGYVLPVC